MKNNHKKDLPQQMGIVDEMLKRGDEVRILIDGNIVAGELTFVPLKAGDVYQVRTFIPKDKDSDDVLPVVMGINPYYSGFAWMMKEIEE